MGAWGLPVEGKLVAQDGAPPGTTKMTLRGAGTLAYSTFSGVDGSWTFPNVPAGVYLLDVLSETWAFSQLRIKVPTGEDITLGGGEEFGVLEYKFPGAQKLEAPYPIVMTAHARWAYFDAERSMGPQTLLGNPMLLISLVAMGLVFLMPRLMDSLEQEETAEEEAAPEPQQKPRRGKR
ncbi:unnamed protein product [Chrysoparadoxa australica]